MGFGVGVGVAKGSSDSVGVGSGVGGGVGSTTGSGVGSGVATSSGSGSGSSFISTEGSVASSVAPVWSSATMAAPAESVPPSSQMTSDGGFLISLVLIQSTKPSSPRWINATMTVFRRKRKSPIGLKAMWEKARVVSSSLSAQSLPVEEYP